MEQAGELVEHLFRRQAGRMTATLVGILGPRNLQLAEDVVQDALMRALQQWPHQGIPTNPTAWLIEVAKNRAYDLLRREGTFAEKSAELVRMFSDRSGSENSGMDDQLAMIFLASHPDIPREARLALTLKTV